MRSDDWAGGAQARAMALWVIVSGGLLYGVESTRSSRSWTSSAADAAAPAGGREAGRPPAERSGRAPRP